MSLQASPISWEDQVVVNGNYFVYAKNPSKRFYMKGIAFPRAPNENAFDMKGWIAILQQLREASPVINTIRIYQVYPSEDYSEFLQAASDLGFYLIIPVTSMNGDGVLSRELAAPKCYKKQLFKYGSDVIESFGKFPNILGYVLGNEVMNSKESWDAAPCILSYARDLKRDYPEATLMYTMQHAGIGGGESPSEAVKLTLDYMSECPEASIDAFGVNIESWCSSTQKFDQNPDGTLGSYKDLYQHLDHSTIPLFFSELGCSTLDFNRDNNMEKGHRDWKQVNAILGPEMIDKWSGFVAYAYDGPADFRMTVGETWDGSHTLQFSRDMDNYISELDGLVITDQKISTNHRIGTGTSWAKEDQCPNPSSASAALSSCCDIDLLPLDKMPSYHHGNNLSTVVVTCFALLCLCFGIKRNFSATRSNENLPEYKELDTDDGPNQEGKKDYQTFE